MTASDNPFARDPDFQPPEIEAYEAAPPEFPPPEFPPPNKPAAPPSAGLEYLRMYSYIFDHPQWGMTVLFAVVCQFIPVIGNIVLVGYQFEIVEQLHRGRPQYPEFNFDNFVAYLSRGIWPFLVTLVISLVLVPVMLLLVGGSFLVASAVGLNEDLLPLVVMLPLVLLGVVLTFVLMLVACPMMLRAALSQQFAEGFNLRFVRDFVSKMWAEILLGTLFLMVTYTGLVAIGMLFCFVGIYPAITLLFLAQAHLYYQLYSIYLARGGEVIPLREPAVA